MGSEPSRQWEKFFGLLLPSLWVTHQVSREFYFIMIVPLLLSCYGFFFVFGNGVSSFGRCQHPPVDGCSTAWCDFGALTAGDEHTSFYSAILNWKLDISVLTAVLLIVFYLFV